MDVCKYPEKPEKPLDSDCCGNGCVPCVMDIYEEELKIWEQECLKLQQKENCSHENRNGESDQDSEDDCGEESVLSVGQYRKVKIISVTQETRDSFRYRLKLPRGKTLGLRIGQHIIIRGHLDGCPVTRQYTPISDVEVKGYFDLLIKIYANGKMSQIISKWKKQDYIDIRGPFGNLEYSRNKENAYKSPKEDVYSIDLKPLQYHTLYMLAVGTGIAPMTQVIQGVLSDEDDETRLRLVYGCRTYSDVLMKKELDVWSSFWNFSVIYALSQEKEDSSNCYRYGDQVHHGKITRELLDTELCNTNKSVLVLVCGTKEFETDMIGHLHELGLSQEQYFRF